ncbi:MAG: EAL domain-containing protein [Xanthobacteraceae bacterium]
MFGYGSLFVAACMTLIAASVAAVLHLALEMTRVEASLIALALLFALMTLEVSAARRRDRADFADRFEGLARAAAEIAREVGELRHRVVALENAPIPDARKATEPLAREIGALAELVEDVAQSVAVHDALLAARVQDVPAPVPAVPADLTEPPAARAVLANGPFGGKSEDEIKTLVRDAIESGRIELYLQPVVTLPQRKVRYYEALSRMRLADDVIVEAARFFPAARAAGLLPKIDERLVHSCVQIVRRLAAKSREVGLFLNIAPETLGDRAAFGEILGYLDANRALAPSLVLEIPQRAYRALGVTEQTNMSLLAERGFRFSLDRIEDFRIDARGLADRGIRFIKVPAELMLSHEQNGSGHIHPADLSDLLSRYGIELVADRIESENIVVDLLDFDVRFGQGFLFAQPRPVRAEVLHGERTIPQAGETAVAAVAAAPAKPVNPARTVRRA